MSDEVWMLLIASLMSNGASALSTVVSSKIPVLGKVLDIMAMNFGKNAPDMGKQ